MKLDIKEFQGRVKPIRDNERYSIHDLEYLNKLNVCLNILHPGQQTLGHDHDDVDEVLVVMDGEGEIELEQKKFPIRTGDIILIKGGEFHRTINPTGEDLVFLTVFEKYSGRGGSKSVTYQEKKPAAPLAQADPQTPLKEMK
jgi:oxalate decarboxylase/phosphoglucose isomerase-like protein (cupin superfamily)